MLSVLLTILKILGILILVVLGLILLILLLVLFVPLRYSFRGSGGYHKEEPCGAEYEGSVVVSWLLHLIHVRADIDKGGFGAVARLFGIPVFKIGKYKKEKKKKTPKNRKKRASQEVSSEDEVWEIPEILSEEKTGIESESLSDPLQGIEPETGMPKEHTDSSKDETEAPEINVSEEIPEITEEEKEKIPLTEKVKNLGTKIFEKGKNLKEKLDSLLEKAGKVGAFLDDIDNQAAFGIILKELLGLIKHYIPRKPRGRAAFALDNPELMGRILMIFGMLYPVTQDKFRLCPDFEETFYIEGDLRFKGHIRLSHVPGLGIRLILKKKIRRLIKRALALKKNL